MKSAGFGAVFGLVAIWLGLFVGLQVNVLLAQMLIFPISVVSYISGVPLMMMSPVLWALGIIAQCATWAIIFYFVSRLARSIRG